MIKHSFPLRVLAISFLVLALPLLVDSFLFFKNAYNESVQEAKVELQELANSNAFSITELTPIKPVLLKELEVFLDLDEVEDRLPRERLNQELKEIGKVATNLEVFLLSLGEGERFKVIASSVPGRVGSSFISFHQIPDLERKGKGAFWRYSYDSEKRLYLPHVFLGRVITAKTTQKPIGILLVVANVSDQLSQILEQDRFGEQIISYALVDSDGIVFAATDPKLQGEYFFPLTAKRKKEILETHQLGAASLGDKPLSIVKGSQDTAFFEFAFKNQVFSAYKTTIPAAGITVIAYSSKKEVFGRSVRHFLLIYSTFALIFIVGGGITYWLTQWMSKPLKQLSSVMGKVKAGDLSTRFHTEPLGFELNLLGTIFNTTLDSMLQTMQRAEDEKVQKETLQREIEIGRAVQQNLLPKKMPDLQGVELSGAYLPANEAGGDFYDIMHSQDSLFLTVADTSGRGISTCLYSLGVRSLIRSQATLSEDVGNILSEANNLFCKDVGASGVFSTVFMAKYTPSTHALEYFSCGHVPALLRRKTGDIVLLESTGMAMGLREAPGPYEVKRLYMKPGDVLLLFTDGLIEATNQKHQFFSLARLRRLLQQKLWHSAREVADGLMAYVKEYQGQTPQEEEIALLVMGTLDVT